jgi:hypothetical protein
MRGRGHHRPHHVGHSHGRHRYGQHWGHRYGHRYHGWYGYGRSHYRPWYYRSYGYAPTIPADPMPTPIPMAPIPDMP